MARNVALGTVGLMVIILVAEQIFPAPWKPSHMMGGFVAAVEVAEIKGKQDYAAGYAAAMSTAQAQGPIAIENNRQQQQRLTDSMGTQVVASNVADLACLGGMAINAISGGDPSYENVGRTLGSACGASQGIRRTMAQEQADVSGGPPRVFETRGSRPEPPAAPIQAALPPEAGPVAPPVYAALPPSAPAVPAQPPVSAEHRIYQQIHFAEWQAKLGTERVRQLREASGPVQTQEGFQEFLNLVEAAAKETPTATPEHRYQSKSETHRQYQLDHQDEWARLIGPERVDQINARGVMTYDGYLNALEEAARQTQ
jgi:hypothetical protein